MKGFKTLYVRAHSHARDEKRRKVDSGIDAAVSEFLAKNPSYKLDSVSVAGNVSEGMSEVSVTVVYEVEPGKSGK